MQEIHSFVGNYFGFLGDNARSALGLAIQFVLPSVIVALLSRLAIHMWLRGRRWQIFSPTIPSMMIGILSLTATIFVSIISFLPVTAPAIAATLLYSLFLTLPTLVILAPVLSLYLSRGLRGDRFLSEPILYAVVFSSVGIEYAWLSYIFSGS